MTGLIRAVTKPEERFYAECAGWHFEVRMIASRISIYPCMPEGMTIDFHTTGPQGGDSGHGGVARLIVEYGSGMYEVETADPTRFTHSAAVSAYGDWELTHMAAALAILGECLIRVGAAAPVNLMPYDVMHPREPSTEDAFEGIASE